MPKSVAIIVGTRAEAIKMAPVHRAFSRAPGWRPLLISTGQHRELLDDTLSSLGLGADHDLDVMLSDQTPSSVAGLVLERLSPLLDRLRPEVLLVQGDTTSAFASALAAYYLRIPVGHVEAGLRTYDHQHPFPEEANRQLIDRLAAFCFAPTQAARANLIAERVSPSRVFVTGYTVVDSLLWARSRAERCCPEDTVLITLHRRESFGEPLRSIILGLRDFLEATPAARVLWPVHPNPNVARGIDELLGDTPRFTRTEPLDYPSFISTLATCRFVLTDSGGLQEEAPSFGKTVLVARERTEREEAIEGGRNRLVGRSRESVLSGLLSAWAERPYEGPLPAPNPFGDGRAAERIAAVITEAIAPRSS